jgi:hypothetical protein
MPYNNPMQMNPHSDGKYELFEELDKIGTYLDAGCHWHLQAANASRKMLIRGFGRWHDCEAKGDFCELEKLKKVVQDKLGHDIKIDMDIVTKAEAYTMNNMEDFKNHFKIWDNNESELIECLNHAIHESRTIDIQIYKCLMALEDEVQDEVMRARMAKDSLAFGGWNPHDISVKSMLIHKYFEHEHKDGGDININLG